MKPNFVIVMADQLRADMRMSFGYPLDTMPFLDSFGARGCDFANAYTPSPTCMPARVSLFTGRYAEAHRVRTNLNAEDALYTSDLLDVLRGQGYRTALCGKNHSHRPDTDFDFHETNMHLGGGASHTTAEQQSFATFMDATHHMETHAPTPGGPESQYPYRNVSDALRFLDQNRAGKPFFIWLSFAEPHNPYQVPEPYFDMFLPDTLPPLRASAAEGKTKGHKFAYLREIEEIAFAPDIERRMQRARSNYHGMLRFIDDQIKRFVQGLDARGLTGNTHIIFVSDHGDFAGEYGLMRKGPELPEVLVHVPMVWVGPHIKAQGVISEHFVSLVDILPTICDILGIPSPFGCQGKSLAPLLQQKNIPAHEFDTAYAESGYGGQYWLKRDGLTFEANGAFSDTGTFECLNSWTLSGQVRMLRKGDYKIQVDMMQNGYLYNLKDDPMEIDNLWDDPDAQATKTRMLAELVSMMLKAADPLPVPHGIVSVKTNARGYWYGEEAAPAVPPMDLPPLYQLGYHTRDETKEQDI